ncbi:hypothetical protein HDV63DRAFT_35680 [Trichoderma sp. SZMC 28014]
MFSCRCAALPRSPYFSLPILSTPLLPIAVQNPNFCPCCDFLSTLFSLFSSSSALYSGVASRPALCPLLFFSCRFPLQARPHPSRSFDLRTCSRQTNAVADFCRFEACTLSPFHRDTRHSFIQLLVLRALQTFSSSRRQG